MVFMKMIKHKTTRCVYVLKSSIASDLMTQTSGFLNYRNAYDNVWLRIYFVQATLFEQFCSSNFVHRLKLLSGITELKQDRMPERRALYQ